MAIKALSGRSNISLGCMKNHKERTEGLGIPAGEGSLAPGEKHWGAGVQEEGSKPGCPSGPSIQTSQLKQVWWASQTAKLCKMPGSCITAHYLLNGFFSFPFDLFVVLLRGLQLLLVQIVSRAQPICAVPQKIQHHENLVLVFKEKVNGVNNDHLAFSDVQLFGVVCLAALQQLLSSTDLFWPVLWYRLSSVWATAPRTVPVFHCRTDRVGSLSPPWHTEKGNTIIHQE